MFSLIENRFVNEGICKYEDENGNRLFMKRTDDGFVAKLRFANKDISADPFYVTIPLPDGYNGQNIRLNFLNKPQLSAMPAADPVIPQDVNDAISCFHPVVTRWISMLSGMKCLETDNSLIARYYNDKNPGEKITGEDIAKNKLAFLGQFEELSELISVI